MSGTCSCVLTPSNRQLAVGHTISTITSGGCALKKWPSYELILLCLSSAIKNCIDLNIKFPAHA